MSREELIKAYRLAHLDWQRSEEHQMKAWEIVKETPEYKSYKEAEALAQRLWEEKNKVENACWKDCEGTGAVFEDIYTIPRDEQYE